MRRGEIKSHVDYILNGCSAERIKFDFFDDTSRRFVQ